MVTEKDQSATTGSYKPVAPKAIGFYFKFLSI